MAESNEDIKKDYKEFLDALEENARLDKVINDFCYNTLVNTLIQSLERDMMVIMFNTLVETLSKTNDTRARLNIVDQLLELAYKIKASGRTTKIESDKILCFYGFLHVLYKHELYPEIISQERVDRKIQEVGRRDYQDYLYTISSKSIDEISYQYKNDILEIKRIYGK